MPVIEQSLISDRGGIIHVWHDLINCDLPLYPYYYYVTNCYYLIIINKKCSLWVTHIFFTFLLLFCHWDIPILLPVLAAQPHSIQLIQNILLSCPPFLHYNSFPHVASKVLFVIRMLCKLIMLRRLKLGFITQLFWSWFWGRAVKTPSCRPSHLLHRLTWLDQLTLDKSWI